MQLPIKSVKKYALLPIGDHNNLYFGSVAKLTVVAGSIRQIEILYDEVKTKTLEALYASEHPRIRKNKWNSQWAPFPLYYSGGMWCVATPDVINKLLQSNKMQYFAEDDFGKIAEINRENFLA